MAFGVKLLVWGDYASFNRPEMKVERVSYDVITPSAARGILEAIYWKPQMRWIVDRIHVLAPILFTHVRRNELSSVIPVKGKTGVSSAMQGKEVQLGVAIEDQRQQRASMLLKDVRYGIEAHVVVVESKAGDHAPEAKHLEMWKRRASRGQHFHHPYLGCREFPAFYELVDEIPSCPESLRGDRSLGYMLHDIEYEPAAKGTKVGVVIDSNQGRRLLATPRFFRAEMVDGVIDVPPLSEGRA